MNMLTFMELQSEVKKSKIIKVLHLPNVVGGNAQELSRSLCSLGLESKSLTLFQSYLNYSVDVVLFQKGFSRLRKEFWRYYYLIFHMSKVDVIHYNFGSTLFSSICPYKPDLSCLAIICRIFYSSYVFLMQYIELSFMRLLRKPIFIHYQGDDARQGVFSIKNFKYSIASQVDSSYYNLYSDRFKQYMIRRMDRFCDKIYAVNPDLLHVLPSRACFIPYCHLSLDEWLPSYNRYTVDKPLRIGHAPTHRMAKGTDIICKAVNDLKNEGFLFDFEMIEGLSREDARKKYQTIDVLIDQLFAGWYGGLAVELMALGKPVLVYIREDDLQFIPSGMRDELPFIQVTPDSVKEGLRTVLEMPRTELLILAKQSRAFVEKWHDPLRIASEIKSDYESALRKRGKF